MLLIRPYNMYKRFFGPYVIACQRLADITLHDSAKDSLVCQLILYYFKYALIYYERASIKAMYVQ